MKKITYIIAGGLLIATACNKPAEIDQAACERAGDSIAMARCMAEEPTVQAEYSEMCTRQLAVLTATRDSLSNILATASNVKPRRKTTTTKKEEPKPDPEKTRGGATGSGDQKDRGGATKQGDAKEEKTRGGATKKQ